MDIPEIKQTLKRAEDIISTNDTYVEELKSNTIVKLRNICNYAISCIENENQIKED